MSDRNISYPPLRWVTLVTLGVALGGLTLLGTACDEDTAVPDTRPPAFVHDLSAFDATRHTVSLTWSAPGDDWNDGQASAYDVRYAQSSDSLSMRFRQSRQAPVAFAPSAPGTAETLVVDGLDPGTRYHFAVKTADEVPNWSEVSDLASRTTLAPVDRIPPEPVDDLYVYRNTSVSLTFQWRSPVDEGGTGYPHGYDLRYSTVESSAEDWWDEWTEVPTDLPTPSPAGTLEEYLLEGLEPQTTYYVALTSFDASGNTSALSNVVSATTRREQTATFRLEPDGSGDFATIQEALDAAISGDVIELAPGTYRGAGNRDLDFAGKALTLMTAPGAAEAAVIDCEGSSADPHRAILFESFEGRDTRIEDLVLQGGFAPAETQPTTRYGGAVLCRGDTSPTFLRVTFRQNAAVYGGAVFTTGAAPRFEDCAFEENEAESGGGAVYGSGEPAGGGASFHLLDCIFEANVAAASGGALMFSNGGAPVIEACTFLENESPLGGALKVQSDVTATFDDCFFVRNRASGGDYPSGGAVHLHGGAAAGADAEFYNCHFEENSAADQAGAVYCSEHGRATFSDCVFRENQASEGAALYCYAASGPTLTGCTLSGNLTEASSAAIVCLSNSSPVLERLLVAFTSGGAALDLDDTSDTIEPLCCDFFGNDGGDWNGDLADYLGIDGNIAADPRFCDAGAGDLTLRSGSPCSESQSGCGRIGVFGVGCR